MVGVREDYLRVEIFEVLLRLPLYRGRRAHGHERRRFDHAVRSCEASKTRAGWIGGKNFERKWHPWECISRTSRFDCAQRRSWRDVTDVSGVKMRCHPERSASNAFLRPRLWDADARSEQICSSKTSRGNLRNSG